MINIIGAIISGLVIGILARFFYPGAVQMGWIATILLGIGGALLAGAVGQHFGWYAPGQPAGFAGALLGAIAILLVVALFRRPRERRIFKNRTRR